MTLIKLSDPMKATRQIPCTSEDHIAFKKIAADEDKTMTILFHEWIGKYEKRKGKQ